MSESALIRAVSSLRLAMIFVSVIQLLILFFVNSIFNETFGYCDTREKEGSSSFGMLMLTQLFLLLPVLYFFHETSLYSFVADADAFSQSDSSLLGISFALYSAASGLVLYTMIDYFLNGVGDHNWSTTMTVLSIVCSFFAVVLLYRFERART